MLVYKSILSGICLFTGLFLLIKLVFPIIEKRLSKPNAITIYVLSILLWVLLNMIFFSFRQIYLGSFILFIIYSITVITIQIINTSGKLKSKKKLENIVEQLKPIKKEFKMEYSFLIKKKENYEVIKQELLKEISNIEGITKLTQKKSKKLRKSKFILVKVTFLYEFNEKNKIIKQIEAIIKSNKNTVFIEN